MVIKQKNMKNQKGVEMGHSRISKVDNYMMLKRIGGP